jgi:hypothetical protein
MPIILVIKSKGFNLGGDMEIFMWVIIAGSILFVYYDATKNKIGKIEGEKGLFNNSAGMWAIGTWLLWIVVLPLYIIKRTELIEKAKQNPVNVPEGKRKVILCIIFMLFVLVFFVNFVH